MRYTVDMNGTDAEHFNVIDTFTNTTVGTNLDAEGAQGMVERRNADFKEASDLAERIGRFVNAIPRQEDAFVAAMGREHRTLQQNFTRLCRAWFEHLAELKPGEYDLRNQGSVEMAKAITKTDAWLKAGLPYV